ncbi:MAG TPA: hypothetical protein VM889_07130 [Candidatus Thermoplasmatota archaeon]|nr:hypothetical protein [Candidatus Thermoplasmatota archaeon]
MNTPAYALALAGLLLASPTAMGAGDSRYDSEPALVFLAPREDLPPPSARLLLEGAMVAVRIHNLDRVETARIGDLDLGSHEIRRSDAAFTFASARGVADRMGGGVVLAVERLANAAPYRYAFEGEGEPRFSSAADVTPRHGAWRELPRDAFSSDVGSDHVVLDAREGRHVVEGTFAVYVWDVEFNLANAGETRAVKTGVTWAAPTPLSSVERWTWARIEIADGRLVLDGRAAVEARGDVFTLTDATGSTRFEAVGGRLAGGPVASADRRDAALVAPAGSGHGIDLGLVALAVALTVPAGAAVAVLARRRAPTPAPASTADAASFLARGRAAAVERDFATALRWFDAALALAPDLAVAHLSRGLALEGVGRADEAAEAVARAAAATPPDAWALYHHARHLAMRGATADALARLQLAAGLDPATGARAQTEPAFEALADHPIFAALGG